MKHKHRLSAALKSSPEGLMASEDAVQGYANHELQRIKELERQVKLHKHLLGEHHAHLHQLDYTANKMVCALEKTVDLLLQRWEPHDSSPASPSSSASSKRQRTH